MDETAEYGVQAMNAPLSADLQLSACPHCGATTDAGVVHLADGEHQYEDATFVVCDFTLGGCGASGPYKCEGPDQAAEAWNRRATPVRTIYFPCTQHMGLPFTMTVGFAPPTKSVCPICEPPK